jgi:hypothetical protein
MMKCGICRQLYLVDKESSLARRAGIIFSGQGRIHSLTLYIEVQYNKGCQKARDALKHDLAKSNNYSYEVYRSRPTVHSLCLVVTLPVLSSF